MTERLTLDEIQKQLFFIVGCGRSGTTLLQVAIGNHPEVGMPHETGFYTLLWRRNVGKLGELGDDASFRAAFERVISFERIRDMELDRDAIWRRTEGAPRTWQTLFLAVLGAFADREGVARVGEKSPGHIYLLGELKDRFPQARFIHIVRDPRAVVLSHMKAFGGTPCSNSRKWKRAIASHRAHADELGPGRYHVVRYESLVSEPEATLRGVAEFLGLPFSEQMLTPHQRAQRGFSDRSAEYMQNVDKPIFRSSIDLWQSELSQSQVALIEHHVGAEMDLMGYARTGARTPLAGARCAAQLGMDTVRRAARRLTRAS